MTRLTHRLRTLMPLRGMLLTRLGDGMRFLCLCLRPSPALAAENLFLRKQLALYQERHGKPRRATNTTRMALIWLAHWFDWRQATVIVQPATLIRCQRQGFRVFWRWKSRFGRPPIPVDLQALIRRMARENPSWGEERIANELLLKLGLRVSPRTVRKYLPRSHDCRPKPGVSSQRWRTFVRNHAKVIISCDFCMVVTATCRNLYVFVVLADATRTILHANVTGHSTAAWTLQQLRATIPADHAYRFLIHDRDGIFSGELDQHVQHLGLRVLKTPPQRPQANALCERLLGTLRWECLDFLFPLTENHVRHLLHDWALYYNTGRPYMALGPGIPRPPPHVPAPRHAHRHRLPAHLRVAARPIFGGLHHAYRLEAKVA